MTRRSLTLDDALHAYLLDVSPPEHPEQAALREATRDHPRAGMQVAPEQARFLQMLVRILGARRTLEIGVFTGYSALSVALALPPDGHLLALDISEAYTSVGLPHWRRAGVEGRIELVLAPALETLDARLEAGEGGTYDFAFIDADKTGYDAYYERCLRLVRPGGLIALDNVLWSGRVAQPSTEPDTLALQALNRKLREDPRVDLSLVPIGDGMTLARRREG